DLKQELMDAALELFIKEGYEHTSVNAICNKVGASKGGFYHHFQSKEEVLENLTQRYIDLALRIPEKIIKNNQLNALEKMNQLILELVNFKSKSREKRFNIIKVFETEGNHKLIQKIMDSTFHNIKKPYEEIIEQGISEGLFYNDYPSEAAELWVNMIMLMNTSVSKLLAHDNKNPEVMDRIKNKICFYEDTMERILGIKKGQFGFSKIILNQLEKVYLKD
ncbi:MAG: TetR/AcrR family transcriptional regulator, partial [Clostridia bacterium]|nr:TetR/AcrR family transcriptional regulator [Clostridia bacterium]